MVEVIVEVKQGKLGINSYHIWDRDNREIVCHKQDVVTLIRLLQEALRRHKGED